ncbi:PspC domain-containing protein [Paenibacillus sp. GCM10027626]|uniref:PspC domain-containing protein n=1 Tax=Paenibacillus sp. GCM10027626 TaxID=3273411 RepID=UPI0036290AF7
MNKLYRSRTDHKLSGLCGGLAKYFGIDATLIRLALVIAAFFSVGSVVIIYFLAALIVPKEPTFYDMHHEGPYHY